MSRYKIGSVLHFGYCELEWEETISAAFSAFFLLKDFCDSRVKGGDGSGGEGRGWVDKVTDRKGFEKMGQTDKWE